MKIKSLLLLTLFAFFAWVGPSTKAATILANDNFTLSSGTNVGSVINTQASGTGTYQTIQGSNGMTVTTSGSFGSGNILGLGSNSNTYYRAFNGASAFSLASLATGETLKMSFNVFFTAGTIIADNFSFGFVNTTANSGAGYSVLYVNADLAGDTPSARASEFRYRSNSYNMSDNIASTIIGTSFTEPVTQTNTSYLFQLEVTKLAVDSYKIDYYRDATLVQSLTQNSGGFVTDAASQNITGIAFRYASLPGITTYMDNVSVTLVPEPHSMALLAFGAVALLLRRPGRQAMLK